MPESQACRIGRETPNSLSSTVSASQIGTAQICDLADGELHDKLQNESPQRIVNVGNQAFLLTPCSPFPGGGSTGGCFLPGPLNG